MMLTEMADVLRRAGLNVVERPGWKVEGHGPLADVRTIICHHTAGPPPSKVAGDAPSIQVVELGRPKLRGPLAQLVLGRSGTWYVCAAGRCWHAGETFESWQTNEHAIGIEAEATGVDSWPVEQYASFVRGVQALRVHYGVPVARVLGHKEVAKPKGRKIDPNFSMPDFRAALLTPTTPIGPAPGGGLPVLKKGDTGPAVQRIQRWLGVVGPGDPGWGTFGPATEAKVIAYQKMRGITADGVVGPATYREMGLK